MTAETLIWLAFVILGSLLLWMLYMLHTVPVVYERLTGR